MTLIIIKFTLAVTIVIGLSLITEKLSPRVAGVISGYPLGMAITLFFFGLEVSPEFAAESAAFNMVGITATQTLFLGYYFGSEYTPFKNKILTLIFSSLSAFLFFYLTIWILHFFDFPKWLGFLIPVLTAILLYRFYRRLDNHPLGERVNFNYRILIFRALIASVAILILTSIPKLIGSTWSGLLAAFPTTVYPLVLIIHFTYSKEQVHTLIKNFPIGIISVIFFTLSISIFYPMVGIYIGTLLSFAISTVYLLIYQQLQFRNKKASFKI